MDAIEQSIRQQQRRDRLFNWLGIACAVVCLLVLAALIGGLLYNGWSRLGWSFLASFPSPRSAEKSGTLSALVGSLLVMVITAASAIPLGVAAGVYLEEYAKRNWFTSLIEINISNLAAVPSIIYGLMALGLLVYQFHLGQSILTGGLTLAFLILPIVIVATREALRSIPQMIREAAYALGASRWEVIKDHLLPYSTGGIATGVIIALSRAIGETAPLVTIGAISYIAFLPPAPFSTRPWLTADISKVTVAAQGPETAMTVGGSLRFLIRDHETLAEAGGGLVEVRPGEPAERLRERIDAIEGLDATFTSSGYLSISCEYGKEFRIEQTGGLASALKIDLGGGVYGPTEWVWSSFTVLPIQMFNWVSRPDAAFAANAAAAGAVLIAVTLSLNAGAIVVRARMRRRIKW